MREVRAVSGGIGDKVGYRLLQDMGGRWVDVDDYQFDTISEAVAMLTDYQEEEPGSTFAVARLELAMISRPEKP
jgi:hypothetical protein